MLSSTPHFYSGHLAGASLCLALYARRSQAIIGPENSHVEPQKMMAIGWKMMFLYQQTPWFVWFQTDFVEGVFVGFCFVIFGFCRSCLDFNSFRLICAGKTQPQTSCIEMTHQFVFCLWTNLRFWDSPWHQATNFTMPQRLQEPRVDGPEVQALNRLLAKVVETEAGVSFDWRLPAISSPEIHVSLWLDYDGFSMSFILNSGRWQGLTCHTPSWKKHRWAEATLPPSLPSAEFLAKYDGSAESSSWESAFLVDYGWLQSAVYFLLTTFFWKFIEKLRKQRKII